MSVDFLQSEESQQFFGLVQMLQRSSMVAMGLLPGQEGKFSVNLAEAKAAIDLVSILLKRTEGNLDEMESKCLQGIVTELRMKFRYYSLEELGFHFIEVAFCSLEQY